ncbi:LINE-1 reverse transcriptase-like [Canna indica]|uniref:LINE-1 reverse transcriptase-like n=1 Tax=Canna indica TaxID=4628 RepID=A0AAQ3Q0X8_9LILI|nr:LINE-1 reverse transcriptase-like [Canna indica]
MTIHNEERLNCMGNSVDLRNFSRFIADMGLIDTPLSGSPFTWTNNQNPPSLAKLDRILISNSLALAFPELFGRVGDRKLSDHHPLILRMAPDRHKGIPPFRIEISWLLCDQFGDIIKAGLCSPHNRISSLSASQQAPALTKWLSNWKSLRRIILDWDKTRKRKWKEKRIRAEDRLQNLNQRADSSSLSSAELEELKQAKAFLDKVYNNECIYWRQRAKQRWLREGDRNFIYFHLCASNEHRRNLISTISVSGTLLSNWGDIASAFRDFYVGLLGSNVSPLLRPRWSALYQNSHMEHLPLDDPFTMSEVYDVIKNAKHFKSPGPDRLTMEFYSKLWPIIGDQLYNSMQWPACGSWSHWDHICSLQSWVPFHGAPPHSLWLLVLVIGEWHAVSLFLFIK